MSMFLAASFAGFLRTLFDRVASARRSRIGLARSFNQSSRLRIRQPARWLRELVPGGAPAFSNAMPKRLVICGAIQ